MSECLGQLIIGGLEEVGNLISGNDENGLSIQDATYSNLVQGNTFGTNADESLNLPNGFKDISIIDSTYLTIGGTSTGYANVLMSGIRGYTFDHPISHLEIRGNLIGISRTGLPRPGSYIYPGIDLDDVTNQSVISYNTITNFPKGIVIRGEGSNVAILNNRIYNNAIRGIDLNNDGVTLNDPPPDADLGPNGLQNFPIISNVEVTPIGEAKQVMLDVSIASKPSTTYYIQLFSIPFCSPSGYGEGKQIFYSNPVTTDSNGYGVIEEVPDFYPLHIIGPCLTATATEFDGVYYLGTSEFSQGVMAWEPEQIFLPMILK